MDELINKLFRKIQTIFSYKCLDTYLWELHLFNRFYYLFVINQLLGQNYLISAAIAFLYPY